MERSSSELLMDGASEALVKKDLLLYEMKGVRVVRYAKA